MSIINDALKKAADTNSLRSWPEKDSALLNKIRNEKFTLEAAQKKHKMKWGPVFVVLVLVLITGPLIAPIFSSPSKTVSNAFPVVPTYQEALATPKTEALENSRKAQFGVEESPLPTAMPTPIPRPITSDSSTSLPSFSINGLVFSKDGDSYCIINGKAMRVGDKINGAKLKSVSEDKAVLDFQGKEIVLWVDR